MSNQVNNKANAGKGFVIVAVVMLLALILFSSVGVVTEKDEYTLIKQFGKVVDVKTEPGLSFKLPFIQSEYKISKAVMLYDMAPSDVITKDKKTMVVDSFVLWRVTDPLKFMQTLSAQISNAENRLDTIVYNSTKNIISSTTQEDVISGRDGELIEAIRANIGTSFEQYGIELVAVETKALDLPDTNKDAVYNRMISERNNIAAQYKAEGESEATKIKTETDTNIKIRTSEAKSQAEEIIAEGEAEYMKIMSAVYNDADKADFYEFVISLDSMKKTMIGENKTIIIDKDSPIAKMFYNVD